MAGLYLHIPFCAKRCLYCDFFSNTRMDLKDSFVDAIIDEMDIRSSFLQGELIETIYFGGGTPSQLSADYYSKIFDSIAKRFDISECKEITLEANPDDMTVQYAKSISELPFNRISMGVQSFKDSDLSFLNRRHNANLAIKAVEVCKSAGIDNISIDLIYGLPAQTIEDWERNIDMAVSLDIPHLSAYHLIYEEGTALYKLLKAGTIKQVDEDISLRMFEVLIDKLHQAGYEQYEISNFCKNEMYSKHNSSYWNGKKYLGLGPSAHSYDGNVRTWNVSSMNDYIKGIQERRPCLEIEELDVRTKYNDYIITRLRTKWGADLNVVEKEFGKDYADYLYRSSQRYLKSSLLKKTGDKIMLTKEGIFVSDGIMSDLICV